MRIGILTFHKAQNYGAFMQCYSLSKKLQEEFPEHKVEVVDYSSYNLVYDYDKKWLERVFGGKHDAHRTTPVLAAKRLLKMLLTIKQERRRGRMRKKRKENFTDAQKHLPLSSECLVSDDAAQFKEYIGRGDYQLLIVGSDAIWNDNQTSRPNKYYLHDITGVDKLSYAASTYGMDYSNMSTEQKQYVSDSLKQFSFVGVRDKATKDFVLECSNGKVAPCHTCDPSAFLDLEGLPVNIEDLKQKLQNKGVDFTKPVIGLMCSDWLAKAVRKAFGDTFQLVSVYTFNGYEDVFLDDLTPFEWARVFSLFDATFTHFFHGIMFSLKNGTLTFAVEKATSYKAKYQTKIQDVLTRMQLLDECYYEMENMTADTWNALRKQILHNNKPETNMRYRERMDAEARSLDVFLKEMKSVMMGHHE